MRIELPPDVAKWVTTEVAIGRFSTPEEALRAAVHEAKIAWLRGELDAAVAAGGEHGADETLTEAFAHIDGLAEKSTT